MRWPLVLLGLAVAAQLLMPDPIWTTTAIVLIVLYLASWLWARSLARGLTCERQRTGSILVVGDALEEEFLIANHSAAAAVWVEFADESDLPGYEPNRVVALVANGMSKWRTAAVCRRRGVYRLGPHHMRTADPLHFFSVTIAADERDSVLVYPRIVELQPFLLPRGYSPGDFRSRRPQWGSVPATSVRAWSPDDDMRYIHWPATAHRAEIMVRELEQEPTGDVWLLPDASLAALQTVGQTDSLDVTITIAASLAAQLLDSRSGRAVGLLVASGEPERLITEPPQSSPAHLWRILGDLAPVRAASPPLEDLLRQTRSIVGARCSVVVITSQLHLRAGLDAWLAELVQLNDRGLSCAVMLLTAPATETSDGTESVASEVTQLLARHRIPTQSLPIDAPLHPLLTHRRRRTEYRSTPSGGVVAVEVEEEVA